MEETLECTFVHILNTCSSGEKAFSAKTLSSNQIATIKESSLKRKDGFGKQIKDGILNYHTSCYSTYTSKSKIEKFLNSKRKQSEHQEGPKRKHLRSASL